MWRTTLEEEEEERELYATCLGPSTTSGLGAYTTSGLGPSTTSGLGALLERQVSG